MKNSKFPYINPLLFDVINLVFINIIFFSFFNEATSGLFLLRAAIGTPIVLLSFYFESISHKIFKNLHSRPDDIKEIVTEGIYSKVRHPIYLGRICLNLGFLIMFPIFPMLVIAVDFVIIWFIIAFYEELVLMKMFGNRYKKYRERVPMFIPKK